MGNIKEILLVAKEKGYHTDADGNIFSIKKKIALRKTKQNRYQFCIRFYGERVTIDVHRFIGYLKYGDKIFNDGIEVRHFDNNSLNNAWENILIGTHSENMCDIPKEIRVKRALNASNYARRFDDNTVKEIINDRNKGLTYLQLCEKYNTSKSTLSYFFNDAQYCKKNSGCSSVG
jgi:hypothetical protein